MITLQDIDNALDRAEVLAARPITGPAQQEIQTCLSNARGMLRELGDESTASLERMTATLESLSDLTQGL